MTGEFRPSVLSVVCNAGVVLWSSASLASATSGHSTLARLIPSIWIARRSGTGFCATTRTASQDSRTTKGDRPPILTLEEQAELLAIAIAGPDPQKDGVLRLHAR